MGYFYFDESLHLRANFTMGAFAYSEKSLDGLVVTALQQSGLTPGIDEFKSGSRMDRHPEQAHARGLLRSVVCGCRIGLVVVPASPREILGVEALSGLKKILSTNTFASPTHSVFFDEGIFPGEKAAEIAAMENCNTGNCTFHFEQDAVRICGLQVADLISHTCATMLLEQLGLVKKTVISGHDYNYEPGMPLGFELWAGLRYNFFAEGPPPYETWKSQADFTVDVESRGLHISDYCDEAVRSAALARFGSMYLGCIH